MDSTGSVRTLFIKTTRAGGYEYIKLVEAYKEHGMSKHRVLFNFGRADLIKDNESFIRVVKRLCEIAELTGIDNGNKIQPSPFDGCSEAELYNYGYLAYKKLWEKLHIDGILTEIQNDGKVRYPLSETVFLMAVQHLLEPRSKLSTYERQNRYLNMRKIPLSHMYRALDKLSEHKDEIESGLFEYNYVRVKKQVDVVFYDVTTFAFESVVADELKDFGYSKDCKFNEVQVVMGMIIDANGIPVGYEIYPGNTFDGKTMINALGNIKKRFGIHRVIIVADRGINSKGNLNLIKAAGYGYIMASRIKSMGKAIHEKIFNPDGYIIIKGDESAEDFRYKTVDYINVFTDEDRKKHNLSENLIITYSQKRAKKDKSDRDRLIEKAKKLISHPEKITASNKRGGRKYIRQENADKPVYRLEIEKIEQDALYDGYYGIQTSDKDMPATDVIEAYHMLWKIEESFRIMKSTMEVRPVFHWTPSRILGHFVVCFLAFLMERKMEYLLKNEKDDIAVSPQRIQEALNNMQLAAVTANGREYLIKVKPIPLSNKIFTSVGLKMPPNVSLMQDIFAYINRDSKDDFIQMALG
jgi:transposase